MTKLIHDKETYSIIGAAMTVHRTLGSGFLEAVYQEALEIELTTQKVLFKSQKELAITYRGCLLRKKYIADFLIFDRIIVEIKATTLLTSIDEAQLLNYLKATGCTIGLLINFGGQSLEWKRRAR